MYNSIIFKRKSIRKFTNKEVERSKIEMLLRAAMQAPSAGNQQEWEFLVVQDETMRKKLTGTSKYAAPAGRAPLDIIVMANQDKVKYPENMEQDISASVQNILLQAVHMDLGAVWLGVATLEDRMSYISELFKLPENIVPIALVAVGYPDEAEPCSIQSRYDESKVHYEHYEVK